MIQAGKTYKLFGTKYHYIGTLMDGDIELTVVKRWNRYSQSWVYETRETEIFMMTYERFAK